MRGVLCGSRFSPDIWKRKTVVLAEWPLPDGKCLTPQPLPCPVSCPVQAQLELWKPDLAPDSAHRFLGHNGGPEKGGILLWLLLGLKVLLCLLQ